MSDRRNPNLFLTVIAALLIFKLISSVGFFSLIFWGLVIMFALKMTGFCPLGKWSSFDADDEDFDEKPKRKNSDMTYV